MEAFDLELRETAQMFEVNVQEFKQMKASRRDVLLVKEVWDLNQIVLTSMEEWKKTLWKDINVENMENDTKRFAKEIRSINKEARGWDVFCGLETAVKNMITALRVVAELQNPSIRDRHWLQLMNATGVRFEMSEKTNLNDLLKLNLHEHEDTVREIVDKSVKEMGMEKMLRELEATWAVMEFEHDEHTRTGMNHTVWIIQYDLVIFYSNFHFYLRYLFAPFKRRIGRDFGRQPSSTSEFDDFEIYCPFLGRSFWLAEKTLHDRCGYDHLVGSSTYLVLS